MTTATTVAVEEVANPQPKSDHYCLTPTVSAAQYRDHCRLAYHLRNPMLQPIFTESPFLPISLLPQIDHKLRKFFQPLIAKPTHNKPSILARSKKLGFLVNPLVCEN